VAYGAAADEVHCWPRWVVIEFKHSLCPIDFSDTVLIVRA
jgi:hypothetical protein